MSDLTLGNNNNNSRWVRNLSRRPLTKAKENILSHGPNYASVNQGATNKIIHSPDKESMPGF